VARSVNEGKRNFEKIHELSELYHKFKPKPKDFLEPARRKLKEAEILVENRRKQKKKRIFFLFNDLIIVAKANSDGTYNLRNSMHLSEAEIEDFSTSSKNSFFTCFFLSFFFFSRTFWLNQTNKNLRCTESKCFEPHVPNQLCVGKHHLLWKDSRREKDVGGGD
jgi:hypothetical protein